MNKADALKAIDKAGEWLEVIQREYDRADRHNSVLEGRINDLSDARSFFASLRG